MSFSVNNHKILCFDQNCIYILQNILNFKAEDISGNEHEISQCIKLAVDTIYKLALV